MHRSGASRRDPPRVHSRVESQRPPHGAQSPSTKTAEQLSSPCMNTGDTMEQHAATRMELELEGLSEIRRRGRGRSGRKGKGGRNGGVQMQVDEVGVKTSRHNKHLCTCTGELQGTNDLEKFVWRMATPFGCLFFVVAYGHQVKSRRSPPSVRIVDRPYGLTKRRKTFPRIR